MLPEFCNKARQSLGPDPHLDRVLIHIDPLDQELHDAGLLGGATAPDRYTISSDPEKRSERIFIDYLRNGRGTTAIGAWSPRARAGFPIAVPVSWRQVENGTRSDAFTMEKPPRR